MSINFIKTISTSADLCSYMNRRALEFKTIEGFEPVIEVSAEDAELLSIMAEEGMLRMERTLRKTVRTQQMRKAGKNRRRDGKVRHNGKPLAIKNYDNYDGVPRTLSDATYEWLFEIADFETICNRLRLFNLKERIMNRSYNAYKYVCSKYYNPETWSGLDDFYNEKNELCNKLIHLMANMPLDEFKFEWYLSSWDILEDFDFYDKVYITLPSGERVCILPILMDEWEYEWLLQVCNNLEYWEGEGEGAICSYVK